MSYIFFEGGNTKLAILTCVAEGVEIKSLLEGELANKALIVLYPFARSEFNFFSVATVLAQDKKRLIYMGVLVKKQPKLQAFARSYGAEFRLIEFISRVERVVHFYSSERVI